MNITEKLIDMALYEDIFQIDITTESLIDPDLEGNAVIIAKESLLLAGIDIAEKVFHRLDKNIIINKKKSDGKWCDQNTEIAAISGKINKMLMAERTAVNFLQHLSGIATLVNKYVKVLSNSKTRIVDTRKTTPGLRYLEKYAVRIGGANNHRMGLYDGVLIKDNHIAACGGIFEAVSKIKKSVHHLMKIEIEVENINQVHQALDADADVIMLDNMNIEQIKEAVKIINKRAVVEVSGGINIDHIPLIANCGVDIISIGALTHSARAVDISMKIL